MLYCPPPKAFDWPGFLAGLELLMQHRRQRGSYDCLGPVVDKFDNLLLRFPRLLFILDILELDFDK